MSNFMLDNAYECLIKYVWTFEVLMSKFNSTILHEINFVCVNVWTMNVKTVFAYFWRDLENSAINVSIGSKRSVLFGLGFSITNSYLVREELKLEVWLVSYLSYFDEREFKIEHDHS